MHRPVALLVDDDHILRRGLMGLARRCGFEVIEASNGVEALDRVRQRTPDLIVTDLHMPQMGGKELIRRLRELPVLHEKPIMVVTADESRASKIQLLQTGADDFIVKPIDPGEFQARLRALGRRSDLVVALETTRGERDEAREKLEQRNQELEQLTLGLVAALERANSLNDSDTGNHIRRVSEFAGLLARVNGCPEDFCDQVRRYAGLHDVGKVGIRDGILKKPGKLTPDEYEEMKTHTLIGGELLRDAGLPEVACNIALCHHERWDGRGYPCQLGGEAIPLEARIVSVVDVYDALRSKRCYKPSYSWDEAVEIMRGMAGEHLDAYLVDLFLGHHEQILEIAARFSDELEVEEAAAEVWG
jgi:putative two-component system response regulator